MVKCCRGGNRSRCQEGTKKNRANVVLWKPRDGKVSKTNKQTKLRETITKYRIRNNARARW